MPTLLGSMLAIAVGASLGAWARWGLSLWLNSGAARLPWGTLLANGVGAYLIGLALGWLALSPTAMPDWLRLALMTGFLGGLTTFSTFSGEVVGLLQQGRWLAAVTYIGASLVGSLLLTAAGMLTVHFVRHAA